MRAPNFAITDATESKIRRFLRVANGLLNYLGFQREVKRGDAPSRLYGTKQTKKGGGGFDPPTP